MVSVGVGARVGIRHPASTPVDTSGPGMAGFVPHAATSLVNGGYGFPVFGNAVPSASGGAIPVAGFPDSAGAPQGVAGLAGERIQQLGHTFRPLRAVVHPLQVDQAPELARPVVAIIGRS